MPPGAEIEIAVKHPDPGLMAAVIDIKAAAAARTDLGIAADHLERHPGAILAGDVGTQPVVPGVADTEADEGRALHVLLIDPPTCGPDERIVGLSVRKVREALQADADVAAEIPAAYVRCRHDRRHRLHTWQIGRTCHRRH